MEPPFAEHSKEKLLLCQHSPLPSVAAPFRVRHFRRLKAEKSGPKPRNRKA